MDGDDDVADDDDGESEDEEDVVDVRPVVGVEDGVVFVRQVDVAQVGCYLPTGHPGGEDHVTHLQTRQFISISLICCGITTNIRWWWKW